MVHAPASPHFTNSHLLFQLSCSSDRYPTTAMMVPVRDGEKQEKGPLACTPLLPIQPKPITINLSNSCFALQTSSSGAPTILIPVQTLQQHLSNNGSFALIPTSIQLQPATVTHTASSNSIAPIVTPSVDNHSREIVPNMKALQNYVTGLQTEIPPLWRYKDEPQEIMDLSQMLALSDEPSESDDVLCPKLDSMSCAKETEPVNSTKPLTEEMRAKIASADVDTIMKIIVGQNRLFCCEFCETYFPTYSTYIIHKACHSSENEFQCNYCGVVFDEKHDFLTHFMHCAHD
jgi:hypothetical protein